MRKAAFFLIFGWWVLIANSHLEVLICIYDISTYTRTVSDTIRELAQSETTKTISADFF